MKLLIGILVALFLFSSLAPANEAESFADQSEVQQYVYFKKLLEGNLDKTSAFSSCRPDGYRCEGSYQCCGICNDGVCDYGGGSSCRPDGASCDGSYECCGICDDGVCEYGGGSSCRGDGLSCEGSYQCCGICDDGVCKYGN